MNLIKFSGIVMLAAAGAGPAVSAEAPLPAFCRPGAQAAAKVNDCEDNGALLKQATECRQSLAAQVSKASSALGEVIGKAGAGSQSANFAATTKDYGTSAAELARLATLASAAAFDLDKYLDWIVLPEDVDNPEIAGPDMQKYADGIGCYGNNVRGIKAEIAKVNEMKRQLELAGGAAGAFGGSAAGRGAAIKADTITPAPATGGIKTGPVPEALGNYRPGESGISGTEDVKKSGK